jgi:hypothetical protein
MISPLAVYFFFFSPIAIVALVDGAGDEFSSLIYQEGILTQWLHHIPKMGIREMPRKKDYY